MFETMFKLESPLGPATTPTSLQQFRNRKDFINLYDDNNFLSKEVLMQHPSAILGRRGSGKTAILYHIRFQGNYDIVAKLDSSEIFTQVAKDIDTHLGGSDSVEASLVENSARAWQAIFQSTVICSVHEHYRNSPRFHDSDRLKVIRAFLRKNGLMNLKLYHTVWRALTRLFERFARVEADGEGDYVFLSDFLDTYLRRDGMLDDAWQNTLDLLHDAEGTVLLLIDSLEQFPVHRHDMRAALGGLLHYVGELDRESLPVKVCVCFPAELHQELVDISNNPEKDFESVVTLHWDASELFQMCARRFDIFSRSGAVDLQNDIAPMPDTPSRHDVWDYWLQLLPETVMSRVGIEEGVFAYLSRHTQMLPRHLLHLLNKTLMIALKRSPHRLEILNEDIIEGVRLGEGLICAGVVDGFRQKYPIARDLVQLLLPNMPTVFDFAKLNKLNRKYGYKIERESFEVLDMFVRMGIVGRVVEETRQYHRCRFDYTYNGQLPYATSDTFCLHPAFSGQYRPINHGEERGKPVYPIEQFSDKRRGVGHLLC